MHILGSDSGRHIWRLWVGGTHALYRRRRAFASGSSLAPVLLLGQWRTMRLRAPPTHNRVIPTPFAAAPPAIQQIARTGLVVELSGPAQGADATTNPVRG